jgi:hypothetical protein
VISSKRNPSSHSKSQSSDEGDEDSIVDGGEGEYMELIGSHWHCSKFTLKPGGQVSMQGNFDEVGYFVDLIEKGILVLFDLEDRGILEDRGTLDLFILEEDFVNRLDLCFLVGESGEEYSELDGEELS